MNNNLKGKREPLDCARGKKGKGTSQKGAIIILNTLLFFTISLVIIFAVASPIVSAYQTTKSIIYSKETFLLANSATEEALYRLRNDFDLSNSESVYLTQGEAEISVTNTLDGKNIEINSVSGDFERNINVSVISGVGANFNYGVQVGNGGFVMENNSKVIGNVYANGSILGNGGTKSIITGSAVAAANIPETIDQENGVSGSPSVEINFPVTGKDDFAQSFTAGTSSEMSKVSFYMKKRSNPSNATVRIHSNNSGNPGTVLGTTTLNSSNVTTNYGWVSVVFPSPISITKNSKYWITIETSSNTSKYFTIAGYNAYLGGETKIGTYNSSWSDTAPSGIDAAFRTFIGFNDSIISGVGVGQSGVGDAWANTISSSNVQGTIYCKSGFGNNKTCNTSKDNPETLPMPLSQANIDQFISEAEGGGIIAGDLITTGVTYLGPKKITGNLNVSGSLILTGTVYVEGNIVFNNNASASLSPSYGSFSGVLMSKSFVNLNNNVNFYGSGVSGSYVMLLSTSSCPSGCGGNNAINVSNNVGTVILNAQNGTVNFSNNAGAKSVTAKTVHLNENVSIVYDSGLVNINFSSGPSGGWNISSWQEVE